MAIGSAMDEARELPLFGRLGELARLLRDAGALVLSAEPGAGKTSLAPLALAGMIGGIGAIGNGRILVVEPRRAAAFAAASRMASLTGTAPGREIGYRVRGESRECGATRVIVATPGVAVKMLQDDPELSGWDCVLLDEFHERSAQADLAAALLVEARQYRPGLALVAMSATMDLAAASERLGAAAMEVAGRSFPIETRHEPIDAAGGRPGAFEEAFARATLRLFEEAEGDVLAFLPGAAEMRRAAESLSALGPRALTVELLHGSMPLAEQARVIAPPPGAPRRVVLATSVAETSLTVGRVNAVIDSGLARLTRFHTRSGLNRLVTEREALDRADQRRGRAGRLGPGLCLRAWSASESLPQKTEPEIFRAELSALVLESAIRGSPGRLDLPWIDAPPQAAWEAGGELLAALGALDASGRATGKGRRMAGLGTEPRLAALVLSGLEAGEGRAACLAAALLSERGGSRSREKDIEASLQELASGPRDRADEAVLAEAARLARAAGIGGSGGVRAAGIGGLLAAAFPDRVARRLEYRGKDASFRVPAGRSLRASGPLASSEWIVAVDADAGASEGKVYSGCALTSEAALAALAPIAGETTSLEWRGLSCRALRQRRAGAIELGRPESVSLSRDELAAALCSRLSAEGLGILPWDEAGALAFLSRLRWFTAASGGGPGGAAAASAGRRGAGAANGGAAEGGPQLDLCDAALAASAREWLGPYIRPGGGAAIEGRDLRAAVEALLPAALRKAFEREAPASLVLPSGSSKPIDYAWPGGPSVEARAQEFYGLREHPRVGPPGGAPLVLRLLDPGGKPLQVTSDLPGFWKGAWGEARKELKGRYPKHEWPEDPGAAAPSRSGVKRRG